MKSKTGAKVIGYLSVTLYAIYLISGCVGFGLYYDDIQNLAKSPAYRNIGIFANKLLINYVNAWFAIFFLINFIGILFAVLLLVGIEKSKHGLMLPWMVFDMIGLVVSVIRTTLEIHD